MILYQYRCTGCGHSFEALNNIHERDTAVCPVCAHLAEQQIAGGHFSLPGTDTAFPTAADKWAKRHRRANRDNLIDLGLPVD